MTTRSNSLPQVASSWHEPALPAFSALCDEALRRCSTQHGLPVTPSSEMRLRAWQLCWLAMDAASAPANNLPDTAEAQALPVALIEQLRAAPALPKLNAQTWQELRRARDQQLFAALFPQGPAAAESVPNKALAAMLTDAFSRVGLEQLRGWITPSVTAALARWVSAALLAIDALALSDENSDVAALELVVFVQTTLQRVHGATATADDSAQADLQQPAAVSGEAVLEAKPRAEQAAAFEAQPAASPPAPIAAASDVVVPQPAPAIEQLPSVSTADRISQAVARPRASKPRAIALGAGVVAVAVVLLLMLKSGNVTPPPDTTPKPPPVAAPEPSARVVTPEPPVVEPVPTAPVNKPSKPPRYRNVAAAKRAHAAKKIDDAAYAAALAELEAMRTAKIAKEQTDLQSGKINQRDYQRRVDAINKKLGFNLP